MEVMELQGVMILYKTMFFLTIPNLVLTIIPLMSGIILLSTTNNMVFYAMAWA